MRIVLVEPIYQQNIGYCARVIANFGFSDLWIVKKGLKIEEEAKIYAKHGLKVLENAKIVDNLEKAIRGCDLIVGTTAIEGKGKSITRKAIFPDELNVTKKTAILFGNEATGLKKEELEICDIIVRIPTDEKCRAMNISHALAIILYELRKRRKGIKSREYINENEKELIFKNIKRKLEEMKEKNKIRSPNTIFLSLKRVIARGIVSKIECRAILQFFKNL